MRVWLCGCVGALSGVGMSGVVALGFLRACEQRFFFLWAVKSLMAFPAPRSQGSFGIPGVGGGYANIVAVHQLGDGAGSFHLRAF